MRSMYGHGQNIAQSYDSPSAVRGPNPAQRYDSQSAVHGPNAFEPKDGITHEHQQENDLDTSIQN